MDNPDKVLKNLLEEKWSGTGDIAKSKIVFSLVEHRTSKGLQNQPNINVKRARMTRRDVKEEFFDYVANVGVVYWPKSWSADKIEEAKDLHWSMMEEVKKICTTTEDGKLLIDNSDLPSGWNHIRVISDINKETEPPVPGVLEDWITVSIRLWWVVT